MNVKPLSIGMVHITKWQDIYTDMHSNDSHNLTLLLRGNPISYKKWLWGGKMSVYLISNKRALKTYCSTALAGWPGSGRTAAPPVARPGGSVAGWAASRLPARGSSNRSVRCTANSVARTVQRENKPATASPVLLPGDLGPGPRYEQWNQETIHKVTTLSYH